MANLRAFVSLAALAAFTPAWPAPAPTAAILGCAKVTVDSQRLACFDQQAAALSASQAQNADHGAVAAPPGRNEPDAGSMKLTPEQKLGLPRGAVDRLEATPGAAPERQIEAFESRIRSVSVDARGREVFALENNQLWRQSETKPEFSVRPGDTVRISRGALGSFFLSANAHSATRVSRVR